MRIDASFREDHPIAGCGTVTLRLIRADDADALRLTYRRLSPATRFRRFHGITEVGDAEIRYLTEIDGISHVAIVATIDSLDLKTDAIVGVARLIRLPEDPEVAEAAVTVIDDLQNKGIGRLLLRALAEAARERGVRTLRGEVLASNAPMRRMLGETGAVVRTDDGTTLTFDVPVSAPEEESALRRLLRAAAEYVGMIRAGVA